MKKRGQGSWWCGQVTIPVFLASFAVTAAAAALSDDEAAVIQELKESLSVDDGTWNPMMDKCKWRGVHCDIPQSSVLGVIIADFNLSGFLPASLGNLTNLQVFDVRGNRITGPIPDFKGLVNLLYLLIDGNSFTSIPPTLFDFNPTLTRVSLDYNPHLPPWQIPDGLKNCSNLTYFSAVHCNLNGTFPAVFNNRNFPILRTLRLMSNHIYGKISLGRLPASLETLCISAGPREGHGGASAPAPCPEKHF
ncbi:unnamed protein product [Cuscuta epithymum]|uniref:Leucine-rich repeat-containing N-terminal plant-type domain-containing protein n=1 Tax=Cuscuta epithymum TaxID=186058 RepID=A0AAV0FG71_9ASTE|nr:unnamed protein product [Cuscuta epithymum]